MIIITNRAGSPASAVTRNRTYRSRRQVLGVLAAGGTIALAGCPSDQGDGSSKPPVDGDISAVSGVTERARPANSAYDTVVDVTEEGGDPTGEEPVTDLVTELAGDNTLIKFPEGTYRLGALWLSELDQFGLRGVGESRPRLVPAGPAERLGATWLKFVDVGAFEFEWFTFDFGEEGYGGRFHLAGQDDFLVRKVAVDGQYPPGVGGFRVEVLDEDSTGVVGDIVARDGAPAHAGSTGIWVGYGHAGDLYVMNCKLENFPDNGLYASAPGWEGSRPTGDGAVHVRGGVYKNNNISNVRLGSTASTAKNVRVVAADVPPYGDALNVRGIHLRTGGDHLIENCDIELQENAGAGFGGVVVHGNAGSVTVRDTRIQVDRDDVPAINVLRPTERLPGPTVENVTIEGSAAAGNTVVVRNRRETTIEECDIVQSGPERDGLVLDDVDGTLSSSHISVTGDPIVNRGSTITRRNVRVSPNETVLRVDDSE